MRDRPHPLLRGYRVARPTSFLFFLSRPASAPSATSPSPVPLLCRAKGYGKIQPPDARAASPARPSRLLTRCERLRLRTHARTRRIDRIVDGKASGWTAGSRESKARSPDWCSGDRIRGWSSSSVGIWEGGSSRANAECGIIDKGANGILGPRRGRRPLRGHVHGTAPARGVGASLGLFTYKGASCW